MADVTELMAQVFEDELTKIAFSPAGLFSGAGKFLSRQGSTIGGMAGMGGLIGAGGGAALGGVKGYREARQQGAGMGTSLLHGAGKSLGGALKGGLVGTAVGGLAGGIGGQEAANLVQAAGAKLTPAGAPSLLGRASRFGQRQMYGLTGALPQGTGSAVARARSIGAGAADQAERYAKAKAGVTALKAPGAELPKTMFGRPMGAEEAMSKAQQELTRSRAAYQHAIKMERLGATSVPGYAKALWRDPAATLKHGIGEQWAGSGTTGKALMFGLPAAFAAHEVVKTPQQGETRVGNVGKALGGAAIGLAPVPLMGMLALGTAGTAAGGAAGNVLGRGTRMLTGRRGLMGALPPPEKHPYTLAGDQGGGQVEAAGGNFAAPEYYYSNSAKGQGPEGWS